jgi:hypothetical protein
MRIEVYGGEGGRKRGEDRGREGEEAVVEFFQRLSELMEAYHLGNFPVYCWGAQDSKKGVLLRSTRLKNVAKWPAGISPPPCSPSPSPSFPLLPLLPLLPSFPSLPHSSLFPLLPPPSPPYLSMFPLLLPFLPSPSFL